MAIYMVAESHKHSYNDDTRKGSSPTECLTSQLLEKHHGYGEGYQENESLQTMRHRKSCKAVPRVQKRALCGVFQGKEAKSY